jgi:hypothetical protein
MEDKKMQRARDSRKTKLTSDERFTVSAAVTMRNVVFRD